MKKSSKQHPDNHNIARITLMLLGKRPNIWRISNAFLHVLNFSSKNVKFYRPLMDGNFGFGLAIIHLARGLANVFLSFAFVGPSFFGDKPHQHATILFISHLNRVTDYTAAFDQYFDNLPEKANDHGISSAIVLLNKCRARKSDLSNVSSGNTVPRIVCAPYLSPLCETWHFLVLFLLGLGDAVRALFKTGDIRRVGVFVGLVQASARSLAGLRFRWQILHIVKATCPKIVVFTYEGHPWERLLCHAIRTKFPLIELIGYQHSIVLPGPKSMTSNVPLDLTPHRLMVTSELTASLLREGGGFIPSKVIPVGSPKFSTPTTKRQRIDVNNLLVLPEGTPDDTLPMAEFAIELGALLKKENSPFTVTLRLHPLLHFDWLKQNCEATASMSDNVFFSTRKLTEDASDAGWLLYRGSAAIFTSVAFGGRPLFLDFGGDATTNDPLALAGPYRKSVTTIESVRDIMLADFNNNRNGPLSDDHKQLINFTTSYFPPLDRNKFVEEIRYLSSSSG